jgi:AraC-like DNA-binding protein
MPRKTKSTDDSLKRIVGQLPVPLHALDGQHAVDLAMPDSIVCFFHRSANEVNRPAEGRALHHRHVLMFALETAVTVCVDDRFIRLNPGEGLLVLPFQFHNYIQPEQDKILWLFVTFEMADGRALEALRFRVFAISPPIRQLIHDMLRAYLTPEQEELTIVTFALLLIRIRQTDLLHRDHEISSDVPELVIKINQLAQGQGEMPSVKEMARGIGISASHLRARFKASCGVSLGRHLRRLRMEKARGLLLFSSARVSDIAEQCGFNSIFSFSRSFRTAFGVPPLAYRRSGGRSQTKGAAPGFVAKK